MYITLDRRSNRMINVLEVIFALVLGFGFIAYIHQVIKRRRFDIKDEELFD